MPGDSLTLRQAVVLGFLSEEDCRAALERAGDPSQALAELATAGKLSASQIERARKASSAGQATQPEVRLSERRDGGAATVVGTPPGAAAHPATIVVSGAGTAAPDGSMIGRTIGGCRIEGAIGAGGMGAVYRARHLGLDKSVAIKILPPHFARSQELIDRFQREARAVAKIEHPNIVGVLNVGFESGLHFIVMPIVDGQSLSDRLGKGPIPPDEAIRWARGVAEGLAEAHRAGIVHRDVKPENILVAQSGVAKLIDFGLAREGETPSGLTEAGQLLGTPHYMSPEQCRGEAADARSDVYALGATLYHALSGRLPHEAKSLYELLDHIVRTRPPAPHEVNPAVPLNVSHFVLWMMEPDRARRPASMEEVARGLAALERGSVISVPAPTAPGADRAAKRLVALFAVLVVLVVVFAATVARTWRRNPGALPPPPAAAPPVRTAEKEPAPPPNPKWIAPKPKFMAHHGGPAPGADRGGIRITVLPEGAQVWVDNMYATQSAISGGSPCEFTNLPCGPVVIWAQAEGCELYEEHTAIFKGGNGDRFVSLRPISAEVRAESNPPGALVVLDGKSTGLLTPCTLPEVAWGEHKVLFTREGFWDEERPVTVDSPELRRVSADLKKSK